MIKLQLPEKPTKLTTEVEKDLVEAFNADRTKAVWDKAYILRPLRDMSNDKCAYCEMKLKEESKPLTIDHYRYKNKYKDLVVRWGNLLPCCQLCNSKKGDHDVEILKIVNPLEDDPKDYFCFWTVSYIPKIDCKDTTVAKFTIERLGLNNIDRVTPKFKVAKFLGDNIMTIRDNWGNCTDKSSKYLYSTNLLELMKTCDRTHQYSAFMSTSLLENPHYISLKSMMQVDGLWSDEIQSLENELSKIAYI